MRFVQLSVLAIFLWVGLFQTASPAYAQSSPCANSRYSVNQTINSNHFMVARYNHKKGSPGRLDIPAGIQFELLEGPICESQINWWKVEATDGDEGWLPESGPHSLVGVGVGARVSPATVANSPTGSTSNGTQGGCNQVTTTAVTGEKAIEVIVSCLNVREGNSLLHRIIATVARGSKLKWEETVNGWHKVSTPWGSAWVSGGTDHTRQI